MTVLLATDLVSVVGERVRRPSRTDGAPDRVHTVLVVVLDSATPAITAAVVSIDPGPPGGVPDVVVLAERVHVDARAHGELLAPEVASVLTDLGKVPADLSAVVAGVGPGPFTGLRVGLVTATALADALAIPAYGVCTLDALGAAAGAGTVLVATDARRREVYWAIYRDGVRITEPSVGRPAELELSVDVDAAVGAGARMYADVLGLPVRDDPMYPPPAALAALAADRVVAGAPTEPLTPLYLRRPDAVEPGARKAVS
jgi:tRNA threonylcarbamoyl adenosine modification protein YeaZ